MLHVVLQLPCPIWVKPDRHMWMSVTSCSRQSFRVVQPLNKTWVSLQGLQVLQVLKVRISLPGPPQLGPSKLEIIAMLSIRL